MKTVSSILVALLLGSACQVKAQTEIVLNGKDEAFPQKSKPHMLANYQNDSYFVGKKGVMNLLGGKLLSTKQVGDLSINPAGTSYAVIKSAGKDKKVAIYNLWKQGRKIAEAKVSEPALASCYTSDGTRFVVSDVKSNLHVYNCIKYKEAGSMPLPILAKKIIASGNGAYMAATDGSSVVVFSLDSKMVLKQIDASADVTAMDFSEDCSEFAVLTSAGTLTIYNTSNYTVKRQIGALGEARDFNFHPQGKYISVVTGDSRIALLNLVNESERMYVQAEGSGVTETYFCKDARGGIYMVYNTDDAVHYKMMNELPPYLTKMLDEEVKLRMAEWEKRMPEETLEEYRMRVNDETRASQMRMFEEEIATRMALDMGGASLMAFDSYNPETGMMSLDMGSMPAIYIPVPKEEVGYFMNTDDFEIRNAIYGVGKDDKMEMVYADIYNKKTGKTYTFNNRDRKSLEYLTSDNRFVPLAYVQQSAMDEMKLDEIKQNVVSAAKQNKSISDHTNISVSTKTISDVAPDGTKHVHYQVSFGYTVDAAFSEREDFAPGRYRAEHSAAAQAMLSIINKAMLTDFASYTGAGKKVKVTITGSADASPIKKAIAYGGEYGDIKDEPVLKNDESVTISVSRASGITTNDQLAYLRAAGMKQNISKNVTALKDMDAQYETHIEQAEGVGGQYRRIRVDFTFFNAF